MQRVYVRDAIPPCACNIGNRAATTSLKIKLRTAHTENCPVYNFVFKLKKGGRPSKKLNLEDQRKLRFSAGREKQ